MKQGTVRSIFIAMLLVGALAATTAAGPRQYEEVSRSFIESGPTPAYQHFAGPPQSAIFTNVSGGAAVGLRITYSSPVPTAAGYGMLGDVSLQSNEGMIVEFSGDVPAYGGVYITWDEVDAKVLVARWIMADGSTFPVDLHQPFARMRGNITQSIELLMNSVQVETMVELDARSSTTSDGTEIVRYQWVWDDGFIQEGPVAERTLTISVGFSDTPPDVLATVTLTVWAANGTTSSVTREITIPWIVQPV